MSQNSIPKCQGQSSLPVSTSPSTPPLHPLGPNKMRPVSTSIRSLTYDDEHQASLPPQQQQQVTKTIQTSGSSVISSSIHHHHRKSSYSNHKQSHSLRYSGISSGGNDVSNLVRVRNSTLGKSAPSLSAAVVIIKYNFTGFYKINND